VAGAGLRVAREVAGQVVRHVRRHDLVFYAAGLTFYAAVAVVPLLLVAWFVTSLVLGQELVRTLTVAMAGYAPTSLGLREGVRSLGEVGPRLPMASFAAALVPATSYGDGLARAMDRVAEWDRRAKGLRGRLLALVFGAALTGSFLSGMSLTWLFLLRLGVDVGIAFGDSDLLGTVVVAAVYLYLVQVVLLGGYVLSLVLARTLPGSGGRSALADDRHDQVPAVAGRADVADDRAAGLEPRPARVEQVRPGLDPGLDGQ
jgi:membrane protein